MRGESDRSNGAESVFSEAFVRISDRTDEFFFDVASARKRIDEFSVGEVDGDRIHRKVPPRKVVFDRRRIGNAVGMPSVRIARFGAESRRFDVVPHEVHGYRSVRDPRRNDAVKETHDVFGLCIGCDVVIVRRKSHEYIAHGSSDEVGAETAAGKNLVHFFEDGRNFYVLCATIHV